MDLRTCVVPPGRFRYGIHRPRYRVHNLRETDFTAVLGTDPQGKTYSNEANFPAAALEEAQADIIYEIPNPFPFRGTTYIAKSWADPRADDPASIRLPAAPAISFDEILKKWRLEGRATGLELEQVLADLPEPLLLALAVTSIEPHDLVCLARLCCTFEFKKDGKTPQGLQYEISASGKPRPRITNFPLFEAVANNPHLPDEYKTAMVLFPGAQGGSEIMGQWRRPENRSHIFEYLRRNSYIPWGHYAANMAHDAVRYSIQDLTATDMQGLRHLYYQRTYVRLAEQLGLTLPPERRSLSETELEALRLDIQAALAAHPESLRPTFDATLWGWNFGFDFSPSHYRLHASHQQIHQQFALIPRTVPMEYSDGLRAKAGPGMLAAFACGDLVHEFVREYRRQTQRSFFSDYFQALRTNRRMDGRTDCKGELIIYEDEKVMLFVPKAQTSQWELQLACLTPVGNIVAADPALRRSLDHGILTAVRILSEMGARMITTIEYSSRFCPANDDFHLLYAFLPKLPESPGAFSEAQLRWINGHYPEDFAEACRRSLARLDLTSGSI